jgi:5-methylcytosine-specific restriction endonuclease McrA
MSDTTITLDLHNRQQEERAKKSAYMAARYAKDPERYKIAAAERRALKPEEVKEVDRKYRAANADRVKATQLAYRVERREEKRAYAKAYRLANPKKAKAAVDGWYAANPDAMKIKKHNRRARLLAGGRLSVGITEKLWSLQRGKCAACHCNLSVSGHHLDHIMPVSKYGANTDDNVQLLCPPCNLNKNAKHPIDWAQENGRLL